MLHPLGSGPAFGAALSPLPRQPASSLGLAGPAGDVPCACRRLTSLPANALRFAPWPRMVTGCGAAPPGTVTERLPSVIVLSAGRKMAAAAAEASGPSCSSAAAAAAAAGAGAAGVSEWLVLRDGCMRCDADGLHSLSYHPALNAILAVTSRGTIKVIDGTSGATLQASALSGESGTPGGGWAGPAAGGDGLWGCWWRKPPSLGDRDRDRRGSVEREGRRDPGATAEDLRTRKAAAFGDESSVWRGALRVAFRAFCIWTGLVLWER